LKKAFLHLFFVLTATAGFSQTTMSSSGNWNDPTKWTGSNVANLVTEDASISTNVNPTVVNGDNFTVGNVNLVQNNTLSVANGGALTLGNSTTAKSMTTGMNTSLDVKGTLYIWGNLIATSNISISVTGGGKLIIRGNLQLGSSTNITMSGGSSIEVYGNFVGTSSDNVNISGSNSNVLVHGNVSVGSGSNLNPGSGSFQVGGTCSDNSSNFCSKTTFNSALPVELTAFYGYIDNGKPKLVWSTASEKNNDYFIIKRYEKGETFEVGRMTGAGNSTVAVNYEWSDETSGLTGKLYYQLSQVDYDGKTTTFNVITVDMNSKLIEGFSISDDETVLSTQIFDEYGRQTNSTTGFRVVRVTTNLKVYSRKEIAK